MPTAPFHYTQSDWVRAQETPSRQGESCISILRTTPHFQHGQSFLRIFLSISRNTELCKNMSWKFYRKHAMPSGVKLL